MIRLGSQRDWTKSSYTNGNGACVEVRSQRPDSLEITDSKFQWGRSEAPVAQVSPAAFTALVNMVRG